METNTTGTVAPTQSRNTHAFFLRLSRALPYVHGMFLFGPHGALNTHFFILLFSSYLFCFCPFFTYKWPHLFPISFPFRPSFSAFHPFHYSSFYSLTCSLFLFFLSLFPPLSSNRYSQPCLSIVYSLSLTPSLPCPSLFVCFLILLLPSPTFKASPTLPCRHLYH